MVPIDGVRLDQRDDDKAATETQRPDLESGPGKRPECSRPERDTNDAFHGSRGAKSDSFSKQFGQTATKQHGDQKRSEKDGAECTEDHIDKPADSVSSGATRGSQEIKASAQRHGGDRCARPECGGQQELWCTKGEHRGAESDDQNQSGKNDREPTDHKSP